MASSAVSVTLSYLSQVSYIGLKRRNHVIRTGIPCPTCCPTYIALSKTTRTGKTEGTSMACLAIREGGSNLWGLRRSERAP